MSRNLQGQSIQAKRASRGNPGHDITIGNTRCSLKTQADKNIKAGVIHISKYMELGKGDWTDKVEDLRGLLSRFYAHLEKYERIFTLRRLKDQSDELYELVEIPRALLQEAELGDLRMVSESKQSPKPGYCTVKDATGRITFELYFDGGTERKLQIKRLRKDLCIVHANWRFPRQEADAKPVADDER